MRIDKRGVSWGRKGGGRSSLTTCAHCCTTASFPFSLCWTTRGSYLAQPRPRWRKWNWTYTLWLHYCMSCTYRLLQVYVDTPLSLSWISELSDNFTFIRSRNFMEYSRNIPVHVPTLYHFCEEYPIVYQQIEVWLHLCSKIRYSVFCLISYPLCINNVWY